MWTIFQYHSMPSTSTNYCSGQTGVSIKISTEKFKHTIATLKVMQNYSEADNKVTSVTTRQVKEDLRDMRRNHPIKSYNRKEQTNDVH